VFPDFKNQLILKTAHHHEGRRFICPSFFPAGKIPVFSFVYCLYAAPTHKLGLEVYKDAKKFAGKNTKVFYLEGRNEQNCKRYGEVNQIASEGYKPGLMICNYCQRGSQQPCSYYEQFKPLKNEQYGFFVTTHSQINMFDLDKYGFDKMIVDEDPLQSFFTSEFVTIDEILLFEDRYNGDFFEKLQKACRTFYHAANSDDRTNGAHNRIYTESPPANSLWENSSDLWEIAGIDSNEKQQILKHLAVYEPSQGENSVAWQWRLYNKNVNIQALHWLWTALGLQSGTSYIRVDLNSTNNRYRFFRIGKNLPIFKGQIIFLDGTGGKSEADALFERDFALWMLMIGLKL